jgi:hypothetical protein
MYSIRRFGVVKTATIVALMYVVVTAVIFIPIVLISGIAALAFGGEALAAAAGFAIAGVLLAIFYGGVGWVFTAIACVLYNVVAGWVGGIELQLEAVAPPTPSPSWAPQTTAPPTPPTAPSSPG